MAAEQTVRLDGNTTITTVPSGTQTVAGTVTVNAGTGPSVANSWNMRITDGVDIAAVSTSAIGNGLIVSTGSLSAAKTLAGVAGNTVGTAVDFGSGHSNFTVMCVSTGTITGTVTLELSLDNVNWASSTITVTLAGAAGSQAGYSIGRPARYARASLTGAGGTGTLNADLMTA